LLGDDTPKHDQIEIGFVRFINFPEHPPEGGQSIVRLQGDGEWMIWGFRLLFSKFDK
jgi:hypothetical protein